MPNRHSNRRGKPSRKTGPAYHPDIPTAGYYRARLRRDGPFIALQFWLGPPIDPDTGEPMENRPLRWQCRLNGSQLVPITDFWPGCAADPIDKDEFDRICRLSRTMDPDHPFYDPSRAIDRLKSPMPF
jgi:hypothetical protein